VPVPPISSDWVSLAPGRPSARAGTGLPGDCGWCRLAGRPERLRARPCLKAGRDADDVECGVGVGEAVPKRRERRGRRSGERAGPGLEQLPLLKHRDSTQAGNALRPRSFR
jgi:hypothetical protein